ncbi:MAG: class I SAM-dependent methyltransferase [Parachlamydiales bacterium]|nr:class I SAM-dependent methyltransferase [Parachlamydiales bacterium]
MKFIFALTSLFASSEIVDLADLEYAWTHEYIQSGISPCFNGAPEIGTYVSHLRDLYHLEGAVETGTYQGGTAFYFSEYFDQVDTIEIEENLFLIASIYFFNHPNVRCHLGSSEQVLAEILPEMKDKRLLFYLDAHWGSYCPLLDELKVIGQTHRDNCIVMIDDFKVPDRPEIPFDKYGKYDFDYDYIKDSLDAVFSEYTYFYLIPKNSNLRAKFVAIPKAWVNR